jgi:very-short-patch-repair endonuclease
MKGHGYDFSQSLSKLGSNPTPANIAEARKSLYNESITVLLKAWNEARSLELEFRKNAASAETVPNELSRIHDWWIEKPLLISVLRADCSTLPDSNDVLWKHLQACEVRDAEWKNYIENVLPSKEKKCNDELSWAISHLKVAFENVPEGSDKVKIGQYVETLLDGHEKTWNTHELMKLFLSYNPERIKGQIDAMDAQLAELSFSLAKTHRFRDLADDIDAQNALDALLNHYIKNYNRIEGFSHDLFAKALKAAPIWITTLQSTSSVPMQPEIFDILVIDEATQCTMTNLLPMIYRAKRIAVIGDQEQLPAIPTIHYETEKSLAAKFGIVEWLDIIGHAGNDAYKSATKCLPGLRADVISLVEHYRSHPLIIGFANQHIYQQRLRLRKDPISVRLERYAGIHDQHVNGYCVRGPRDESWINPPEKDAVCDLVKQLRASEDFGAFTIGVVTPFSAHESAIRAKLDEMGLTNGITVGTAHKYQGDERDIIVFSPVVAKGITEGAARFVENPHNLINVAVTRAREGLFVVGDLTFCGRQEGILGKLVKYVKTVAELRKTSLYELELFSWMVVQGWNPQVHVQVRDIEVDFILNNHGIKLVVEVDGETAIKQDGEVVPIHEKSRDSSRDAFLRGQGFKVLHFKTRSIRETPSIVLHDITKALELDWVDNLI